MLTAIDVDCFQSALDRITAWCNDWQLQIAVNKCSIRCLGPTSASSDLQIDGNILPIVSTVKDLGITFDRNLSSTSHVTSVVFTATQRVNLLLCSFLTRKEPCWLKPILHTLGPF